MFRQLTLHPLSIPPWKLDVWIAFTSSLETNTIFAMICFTPPLLSVVVLLLLSSTISSVYSFSLTKATDLSKIPIVICPGFGNDEIDYYNPLNQGEEFGMVNALVRRGFNPELIQVLPLKRYEWIRVAGGLFDLNFYTFTCKPEGLGYGWYVKRLRQTIEELYQRVRSVFQDVFE